MGVFFKTFHKVSNTDYRIIVPYSCIFVKSISQFNIMYKLHHKPMLHCFTYCLESRMIQLLPQLTSVVLCYTLRNTFKMFAYAL